MTKSISLIIYHSTSFYSKKPWEKNLARPFFSPFFAHTNKVISFYIYIKKKGNFLFFKGSCFVYHVIIFINKKKRNSINSHFLSFNIRQKSWLFLKGKKKEGRKVGPSMLNQNSTGQFWLLQRLNAHNLCLYYARENPSWR